MLLHHTPPSTHMTLLPAPLPACRAMSGKAWACPPPQCSPPQLEAQWHMATCSSTTTPHSQRASPMTPSQLSMRQQRNPQCLFYHVCHWLVAWCICLTKKASMLSWSSPTPTAPRRIATLVVVHPSCVSGLVPNQGVDCSGDASAGGACPA